MARVKSFPAYRSRISDALALEGQALENKRSIWSHPSYVNDTAVKGHSPKYRLTLNEGKEHDASKIWSRIYLNFADN